MRSKEEATQAWEIWNLLTDVTDLLWKFDENEFLDFYAADDPDWMKNDDDS